MFASFRFVSSDVLTTVAVCPSVPLFSLRSYCISVLSLICLLPLRCLAEALEKEKKNSDQIKVTITGVKQMTADLKKLQDEIQEQQDERKRDELSQVSDVTRRKENGTGCGQAEGEVNGAFLNIAENTKMKMQHKLRRRKKGFFWSFHFLDRPK